MERITFRTAATLSLAIVSAVSGALAQGSHYIQVKVPFNFVAAEKSMPAGEYTVTWGMADHTILIRSADNKHALFVLTRGVRSAHLQELPKLVFHRYGDQCFLKEAWPAATDTGSVLPEPPAERLLAKSSATPPTLVVVASRK
jgi:hypothetical protein